MKLPRITIITPSFNQGHFIEQTIESVLSQQYQNLEYIVIDGGSTDNTVNIVKKYEKYLTTWISEPDNGQSHAINKGLRLATGDVVNWLNSDDYYSPGALKRIGEAFSDPATKVFCGKSNIIRGSNVERQSNGTDIYWDNLPKTIGRARIDQPETFFRMDAFRNVGLLNETLHYVMDKEWWIRYLLREGMSGIRKSNDVIVNFRLHEASKTESQRLGFEQESAFLMYWLFPEWRGSFPLTVPGRFKQSELAVPEELRNAVLANAMLYHADLEYFNLNLDRCRKILKGIDSALLSSSDQWLFYSLRIKSSLFSRGMIKLLRR